MDHLLELTIAFVQDTIFKFCRGCRDSASQHLLARHILSLHRSRLGLLSVEAEDAQLFMV